LNHVVQAYVIGQDAAAFAQALPQDKVQICGDMRTAVAAALGAAQPGEVVLLAPAAASFDQYDSFEARGQDFMQCVAAVLAKLNSASA
jgi:UDP-N-acetylmuramoylalanine--D-glutamate ligase